MPTWPLIDHGAMTSVGTASGAGTTVTASATANTKGAYAQLTASTPQAAGAIIVSLVAGAAADMLVDLAIGTAGSETVIVANLTTSVGTGGSNNQGAPLLLPISIPAGTRLAARCQATVGNSTCQVAVHLLRSTLIMASGLSRVVTLGADTTDSGGTTIDPGATLNTKGAWVQMTASLSIPIRALAIGIGNRANGVSTSANFLIDIGIGGAGSETVLISNIHLREDAGADVVAPNRLPLIPVAIPAGARIAVRAASSITDATDRLLDCILYGVG